MTQIDALKIFAVIAVTAILSLAQVLINIKKVKRARQALMVPISLILSVILVIVAHYNFQRIYDYFSLNNLIAEVQSGLLPGEDTVLLAEESELGADNLLSGEQETAAQTDTGNQDIIRFLFGSEVVLINLLVMLAYLVLKVIVCLLLWCFADGKKTLELTAGTFYYYDYEDYLEWFLKDRWANFRKYLRAVSISVTIATGIWLALTWYLGRESEWWIIAFPIIAVIVVNEMFNFVNGKTKEELEFDVMGEAASSQKISNFNKVRQIFEQTLPGPLLFSHSGCDFVNRESPGNDIEGLLNSNLRPEIAAAKYFAGDERWKKVGMDEFKATIELVKGKNVVFFDPFYRDLSVCLTLPIINALLKGRKCLVVTGRSTICDDVKDWLSEMIADFSRMKSLWRVSELDEDGHSCEVGILSFPKLYDNRLMMVNRDFFKETDFVLFLEPSIIVSTAQIALSILAGSVCADGKKPVYCICDRNCDGLVDTMSHVLQADITTVVAPPVPRCMYTCMCWDAGGEFRRQSLFDKQVDYLGNGVEIGAIAVKNQIPEVNWYCESKAPIIDIKAIAGKCYAALCKFMNIPSQQKSLEERIKFVSNPWLAPKKKENFIIAEDEFCNMFCSLQAYLSRGITQSFVNIISENYLLRDYMRCNKQIFTTNPDAIPSVVPDYAKTERNTLFKLLIEMSLRPVPESEVINEFKLVGIGDADALEILTNMLAKYTFADNSIFNVESHQIETDSLATVSESLFSIELSRFEEVFSNSLRTAYYVLEEEDREDAYVDARLFGQVTQHLLPGQYIVYDGKYYYAKLISPQSGVVLRRASDLYDGRRYYRQIRNYTFEEQFDNSLERVVSISGIEIAVYYACFKVETDGYLDLSDYHDLRSSKEVLFKGDPNIDNFTRQYKNKAIMRIKLPESDKPEEDNKDRYTLCMLLQEVFRTIFPNNWQYIAALTKPEENVEGILNYLVYPVNGAVEDGYIYIVEDSEMDLGLLGAFERNLYKIFSIIADFLDWHFEKMKEPESGDPLPQEVRIEKRDALRRRRRFSGLLNALRRLTGRPIEEDIDFGINDSQPSGENTEGESEGNPEEQQEVSLTDGIEQDRPIHESVETNPDEDEALEEESSEETDGLSEIGRRVFAEEDYIPGLDDDPLLTDVDGTDIFEEGSLLIDPELQDQFNENFLPTINTRYKNECYLKFGYEEIDPRLQLESVRSYLRVKGWCNNEFTKARKLNLFDENELMLNAEIHCDFCQSPLTGVSYEKLSDGRVRCNECSVSAITSIEEYRAIFRQVIETMESFFDIRIRVPVGLNTADADTIEKSRGYVFSSKARDPHRLGYARKRFGKYSIEIENSSPRLMTIMTIVFELTHIWQKTNWNERSILGEYGAGNRIQVYDGMAAWASVQYMYMVGETYFAMKQEAIYMQRNDSVGEGFRYYSQRYPLVKDSSFIVRSPFMSDLPLTNLEG